MRKTTRQKAQKGSLEQNRSQPNEENELTMFYEKK